MRRVVLFASVVVAVVLFVVLFFRAFQRRLIYLPSTGAVPSAATMLAGARDVQLNVAMEGADHNDPALRNGDGLVRALFSIAQFIAPCATEDASLLLKEGLAQSGSWPAMRSSGK